MKSRRTFASLIVKTLACGVLFCLAVSQGAEKTYEFHTLPEYRSDTARAIDAYQQMINRMLDDNDRSWEMIQSQLNTINGKLDKILSDLNSISLRIARIENKMGIEDEPEEKEPRPGELQQEESPDKNQKPQYLH